MQVSPTLDSLSLEENHKPLSRDELRDILMIALRGGQIMLENGANTARVEQTIASLGRSLGAESMDVLVTPHGITASVSSGNEHRTRMQRITASGVDLGKVAAVLDVAQRAERGDLNADSALFELNRIAQRPRQYSVFITMLAVGMACGGFGVLMGAGFIDFLIILVASSLGQFVRHTLIHHGLDRLFTTAIVSAFSSGAALVIALAMQMLDVAGIHTAIAVAASVLLLVPGIPLVSGTSDLFRGDTTSGIARATNALLVVLSIGAGVWATLMLTRVPLEIVTATQTNVFVVLLMGFFAAGGFAILFNVPLEVLPFAGIVGSLAVGMRFVGNTLGMPIEVGPFLAGITIGVTAELLAYWRRTPTSLFSIPGYIPLVPGVFAFRSILHFVSDDYVDGLSDFVRAMLIIIAIAVGLGTVNALVRFRAQKRA